MAFIPVPGCVKVAIRYAGPSSVAAVVCHVARLSGSTSAWGGSEIVAMAAAFTAEWQEEVLSHQNSNCQLVDITYTDLTTVGGQQVVSTVNANGGSAGTLLPDQSAILVKLLTNQRGRSFRGRMYLPYFSTGDAASDGTVNPATLTSINASITGVRTDLQALASPADFCVATRFSGTDKTIPGHRPKPIPRVGGGFFTLIQSATALPDWATQRRRRT